jgi:hypothetical protein
MRIGQDGSNLAGRHAGTAGKATLTERAGAEAADAERADIRRSAGLRKIRNKIGRTTRNKRLDAGSSTYCYHTPKILA